MFVRHVRKTAIGALLAAVGLSSGAAAFGGDQPFSTNFDWISGQESFDSFVGDVTTDVPGAPAPTGDGWAYFLDAGEAFVYDFDTPYLGTLEITTWDTGYRLLDDVGDPVSDVNLRGQRWGAFGTGDFVIAETPVQRQVYAGPALEYRTYLDTNVAHAVAPAADSNQTDASSLFTAAWGGGGGGLARPPEATWVDWTIEYGADEFSVTMTWTHPDGESTYTGERAFAYSSNAFANGAEGIYLFGGHLNPAFDAGEDPSVGSVWNAPTNQEGLDEDPDYVFNEEEDEWGQWGEMVDRTPGLAGLYIDSLSWTPFEEPEYLPGDLNLDGVIDAVDVSPFVLGLTDPAGYETQYGIDPLTVGDINGDGVFDAVDVSPFVQLLVGSGATVVPEPGSLALLSIGGLLLLRRRRAA
ncbi:MAG: dockerin type I repeat-containing protein [Phycisphaeraceae bacterium]